MGDPEKEKRATGAHQQKQPPPPTKGGQGKAPAPPTPDQLAAQAWVYQPRDEADQPLLDRTADEAELRNAFIRRDQDKVLEVLQRNSDRAAMYALRHAYGDSFTNDLHDRLDENHFARARGFVGDQLELSQQISFRGKNDGAAITRDIERMTDQQAWELIRTPGKADVIADDGKGGPQTPSSSLGEVQGALRGKLDADGYYRAMRLILTKADRFIAAHADQARFFGFSADEKAIDPQSAGAGPLLVMLLAAPNSPQTVRVDLAEERVRAADGAQAGSKLEVDAFLALADLNEPERKMLAMRLKETPLKSNQIDVGRLEVADDATVIHQAIEAASYRASLQRQAAKGIGVDVAIERAGTLIRAARAKVADPSLAPPAKEEARKELQRLEKMFYGDSQEAWPVENAIANASTDQADRKDKLEQIGADPVTVGARMISSMSVVTNFSGFLDVLKQIPTEARLDVLKRTSQLGDVNALPAERRDVVFAYLDVSQSTAPAPATTNQPVLDASLFGIEPPEVTIALTELLPLIARGHSASGIVLARLQRMPYAIRQMVFAKPGYRAAVDALPKGGEKSPERDFKDAMSRAEVSNTGPDLALENYPGSAETYPEVKLEAIRMLAEKYGQESMRRGFVLSKQVGDDPAKLQALAPGDRVAVQQYRELEYTAKDFQSKTQADAATDLTFGTPQLSPSADANFDPTMEAKFMNLRLHQAAGMQDAQPLSGWKGGPDAVEALSEFQGLYEAESPGGVSRGGLAQMAEAYYRAQREMDMWRQKVAANEALAQIASTVAGVVVAVGISILSGGTAIPMLAVAGLTGTAAGTAAMAAGAAVRIHSTSGSMAKDFGMGFVDGVTAIAGAGLAARVVRGSAAGVGAGKAAAEIAGHVAAEAAGHSGALAIAEAAIDGAFSGAAGELFQTAVDEATWDRGVGEAIAKMLAAIARGGIMGGVAGGGLAAGMAGIVALARKAGPKVAEGFEKLVEHGNLSEEVLNHWHHKEQEELVEITRLIESGRAEEAEKSLRKLPGLTPQQRELLVAYARGRSALRAVGDDMIELEGKFELPKFKSDADFEKLAGNKKAHAVLKIEEGRPVIYARVGTPKSAILEEVMHLRQWETSATMRARMQHLSEENLSRWAELTPQQKLDMHLDKLEVEADAQRMIVERFSGNEGDEEALMRFHDAQDTLQHIEDRREILEAAQRSRAIDVDKLDIAKRPRLYALGHQTRKPPKASREIAGWIKNGEKAEAHEERLRELGYHLSRDQEGKVFRVTRDKSGLVPLSVGEKGEITAAKQAPTFGEQKQMAAQAWDAEERNLERLQRRVFKGEATAADRKVLSNAGSGAKGMLRSLVGNGIDEATAGLMLKWAPMLDKLESEFGVSTAEILSRHVAKVSGLEKSITDAELSAFRKEVRTTTADMLIERTPVQKRGAKLNEWLEAQPDESSKGALFEAYRDRALTHEVDGNGEQVFENATPKTDLEKFRGSGLKNRRTPDGAIDVRAEAEYFLPPGRYALEDKAGKDALDISQAQDYARRSFKPGQKGGGFKLTPQHKEVEYQGLIYICPNGPEAAEILRKLKADPLTAKILGVQPGGIHIMYVDEMGKIRPTDLKKIPT